MFGLPAVYRGEVAVAHGQEWKVASTTSFRTTDLDEARGVCGDVEYGAEITGRCAHLDNYHINVPVGGLTLERASVDCRILTVQIDRHALEGHLAALLDAPVRGPLRLPIAMDLTRPPGRGWAELVGVLAADITDPNALIHHPLTAGPLQESLLTATLLAMDHQYRDVLERSTVGPRAAARITAAVEAIDAHPEQPYTGETLAELAGVSVRGLRLGFRKRLDTSPMAYLRHTRLARVHDELRMSEPRRTTVREVARRWGFVHLGRFAAAYRERYGATPTRTLYAPHRGRVSRSEVRP